VIEIGKYKLKYLNDQPTQTTAADFEKTMVLRAPVKPSPAPAAASGEQAAKYESTTQFNATVNRAPAAPAAPAQAASAAASVSVAVIQILNGPNLGKEMELSKNLTTLGKPGVQVAVLARRPHGYFMTHVEGANFPAINGVSIGEQPHQLNDHDVIELAGIKMEFYFKA